jgi:hypothetical protein
MTTVSLNRIATAVPLHDAHTAFIVFTEQMSAGPRHKVRSGQLGCAMPFDPERKPAKMRFHAV